jgi:uncharacterized membrane protein YqjE
MKERFGFTQDSFERTEDTVASSKLGRRPISDILQEIGMHFTEIVRSEVQLACAEVRRDITHVAKAGVFLMLSAVFALYAFGFLLLGSVYALEQTLQPWAAALIIAGGVAILAVLFFVIGRKKMKLTSLRPDTTIQSLQENVRWLKKQTK